MGLSAGQARYLFISDRINTVQGALMINSARQMRLADEASDIAEAKDAALNCTHYEFNGNDRFDYDSFMGEDAMNAGKGLYFLLTNDGNNRVVLNSTYARGMEAAKIDEKGGQETAEALYAFMNAVVGAPDKNSGAKDWNEVKTGIKTVSAEEVAEWTANKEAALKQAVSTFDTTYGKEAPIQGTVKLGKANLTGGSNPLTENYAKKTNNDIDDINNITWEQIANGQSTVLSLGSKNHHAGSSWANELLSKVNTIISNLGQTVKNAIPSIDTNKLNQAVQNTQEYYKQQGFNITNIRSNYEKNIDAAKDKAQITCSDFKNGGGAGSKWAAIDLKPLFNYFKQQLQSIAGINIGTEKCKNEAGKTYEEWTAAYNALSQEVKNYRSNGTVPTMPIQLVSVKDDAKTKLANYEQIFSKACQNGWKEDGQLDQANLTAKLANNQYLINHDNVTETAKTSKDFCNVYTNDRDAVVSYYNAKEQKLKSQEKKLEVEQTSLQTELSALQTEEASVKSIIDKNIERGFNLFG
ncbi:hypothetical protein IJ541_11275 [bacterium]|nr:hypothetical protein [bacterium]